MLYTEDEIRKAFWLTFHRSGERWFAYFGPDERDQEATDAVWQEFLEGLFSPDSAESGENLRRWRW